MPDAVYEKDFEAAMDVFLNGADMDVEEEDRSDREMFLKNHGTKVVQYLESSCSDFKIDPPASKEPVQAGKHWHDVAEMRLKIVQQLRQGCSKPAEGERDWMWTFLQGSIAIVERRADCCYGYCFCCFSG